MSRSYKHAPVCKDGNKSKVIGKRFANKKVRRLAKNNIENSLSGKSKCYKKQYQSWDICDYRFWGGSRDKIMKGISPSEYYKHENWWKKWYRRK